MQVIHPGRSPAIFHFSFPPRLPKRKTSVEIKISSQRNRPYFLFSSIASILSFPSRENNVSFTQISKIRSAARFRCTVIETRPKWFFRYPRCFLLLLTFQRQKEERFGWFTVTVRAHRPSVPTLSSSVYIFTVCLRSYNGPLGISILHVKLRNFDAFRLQCKTEKRKQFPFFLPRVNYFQTFFNEFSLTKKITTWYLSC